MIGSSLGPYKILEQLGAGGMGEVYLGEDTRLGRKVAIKVLPAEFASDPGRLARFEQEARAAAALNHPHIAVVHDIGFEPGAPTFATSGPSGGEAGGGAVDGTDEPGAPTFATSGPSGGEAGGGAVEGPDESGVGVHYIVQEYLEGETLREPLKKGALPVRKAVDLATEIAEALAAAHAAGIIHRDLKPENIFITKAGHAKVLDFGLAKLTEVAAPVGSEASASPTLVGTTAGQMMGTAGYMAPEQVQGGVDVDHRADLFAFGCVLYEMASGRKAFVGETVLDTLHAISRSEPEPLAQGNAELPAELQRIVRKCLVKDASRRFQGADDLAVDLQTLSGELEAGTAVPLSAAARGAEASGDASMAIPVRFAVPAAVLFAIVAALTAWQMTRPPPPEELARIRFTVDLPPGTLPPPDADQAIAVSPDGQHFVFAVYGATGLLIRDLGREGVGLVRGVRGLVDDPFFSPDGTQIGFHDEETSTLRKVPVSGGSPVTICPVDAVFGVSWPEDDTILFGAGEDGIWTVSANGGEPAQMLSVADGEMVSGPRLLSDGEWVMFTVGSTDGAWADAQIVAKPLRGGERKLLVPNGSDGRYVPTGHLVYQHDATLWAVPFDVDRVEVVGDAVPMVEHVGIGAGRGELAGSPVGYFDFSQRGDLVYLSDEADGVQVRSLVWLDQNEQESHLVSRDRASEPRISPDGEMVAVTALSGAVSAVWIYEISPGSWTLMTPEGYGERPIWSGDGESIIFTATRDGIRGLWRQPADRSADAQLVLERDPEESALAVAESITADGGILAYSQYDSISAGSSDGWLLELDGERRAVQILGDPAVHEVGLQLHPSGEWIAYQSNVSGEYQIYVHELLEGLRLGAFWIMSSDDATGTEPIWSRDGKKLFWREGPLSDEATTKLMVASVETEPNFQPGTAEVALASLPAAAQSGRPTYDVASDGRVLVTRAGDDRLGSQPTPIHVVLNWFEELKRRVPGGDSR